MTAVAKIEKFWKVVSSLILPPFELIFTLFYKGHVSRRAALFLSLFLTYEAFTWCIGFADANADKDGLFIAAVIGAVMTPIATLTGALLKFYVNSKKPYESGNNAFDKQDDS